MTPNAQSYEAQNVDSAAVPFRSDFAVDHVPGDAGEVRLRVSGELDLQTAPQLTDELQMRLRDGQRVVVDLRDVSFMDSTGLSAIVGAIKDAKRNGWQLAVSRQLSPEVSRLMRLSGLQPLLDAIAADEVSS